VSKTDSFGQEKNPLGKGLGRGGGEACLLTLKIGISWKGGGGSVVFP